MKEPSRFRLVCLLIEAKLVEASRERALRRELRNRKGAKALAKEALRKLADRAKRAADMLSAAAKVAGIAALVLGAIAAVACACFWWAMGSSAWLAFQARSWALGGAPFVVAKVGAPPEFSAEAGKFGWTDVEIVRVMSNAKKEQRSYAYIGKASYDAALADLDREIKAAGEKIAQLGTEMEGEKTAAGRELLAKTAEDYEKRRSLAQGFAQVFGGAEKFVFEAQSGSDLAFWMSNRMFSDPKKPKGMEPLLESNVLMSDWGGTIWVMLVGALCQILALVLLVGRGFRTWSRLSEEMEERLTELMALHERKVLKRSKPGQGAAQPCARGSGSQGRL